MKDLSSITLGNSFYFVSSSTTGKAGTVTSLSFTTVKFILLLSLIADREQETPCALLYSGFSDMKSYFSVWLMFKGRRLYDIG